MADSCWEPACYCDSVFSLKMTRLDDPGEIIVVRDDLWDLADQWGFLTVSYLLELGSVIVAY
jgi:hypothetical protein